MSEYYHTLEVQAYDKEGYVLGHYEVDGLVPDVAVFEYLRFISQAILEKMESALSAHDQLHHYDRSRVVWAVSPPGFDGNLWPPQPVTLPLRS